MLYRFAVSCSKRHPTRPVWLRSLDNVMLICVNTKRRFLVKLSNRRASDRPYLYLKLFYHRRTSQAHSTDRNRFPKKKNHLKRVKLDAFAKDVQLETYFHHCSSQMCIISIDGLIVDSFLSTRITVSRWILVGEM